MSKITVVIPQQNWEYVRKRIYDILVDEFATQVQLGYEATINANIFMERTTPIDKTECPLLTVNLATGRWDNEHQGSSAGTYTFNVDCYTNGKSTKDVAGDTTANLLLQRILGIARYILRDPVYKTLGFKPPYISRVTCSDINIAAPGKDDASYTAMGRMTVTVSVVETNKLIVPELIDGYDTQVKMSNSSQGYKYTGENY